MTKIRELAPAKLNLFLDVTSKRENGYHEIDSVMQSVSLCDEIIMEIDNGDGIEVSCSSPFAPSGSDNIVWRAADRYLNANKIKAALKIELVKNIPSPAGMGGGSSDAAAVLRTLNNVFKAMSYEDLVSLALKIGSDVPFCLKGGAQRVRGIGEILEPIQTFPKAVNFVIAVSGEDVPTPSAYKRLDAMYNDFRGYIPQNTPRAVIDFLNDDDLASACRGMYNIFEDAVLPYCPKAANAKKILLESGSRGAMMSGSGATVFGVFSENDGDKALYAKKKLEGEGLKAFVEKAY